MKIRNIPPCLTSAAILVLIYFSVTAFAIEGDISGDDAVDWDDISTLSINWLYGDCAAINSWCNGADIDESSNVGFLDFAVIANNWLKVENLAPAVNAGPDQQITPPTNAVLNGTVTDDGLPNPPAAVTTLWTKASGPGNVIFADANAVDTTASFSAAGVYVLRLTANDSDLVSYDEVTVTVNQPIRPAGYIRGSVHFHTTNSDGNKTLAEMMGYYRDSGQYDFACVADHDYISNANSYSTGSFLGINGYEASGTGSTEGPHVVGLGMAGLGAVNPPANFQQRITYVISGGGMPMVAHPRWSQETQKYDMATLLNNMANCNLMNVYNRYCERVYKNGNSEVLWDNVLTNGKLVYGYAECDAHGGGDTGFAYNMLHTTSKTVSAIKTAFQSGDFYFCYCTVKWGFGITIFDYTVTGTSTGDSISITTDFGEKIQFIGQNGVVLKTVSGNIGSYTFDGTEGYVRIKITKSAGDTTWTQPVFVIP